MAEELRDFPVAETTPLGNSLCRLTWVALMVSGPRFEVLCPRNRSVRLRPFLASAIFTLNRGAAIAHGVTVCAVLVARTSSSWRLNRPRLSANHPQPTAQAAAVQPNRLRRSVVTPKTPDR